MWCLRYSLPEVALNPMNSCDSPRGDNLVRPLYSTMFGLMFRRAFGSLPRLLSSQSLLRVRKVILFQSAIV